MDQSPARHLSTNPITDTSHFRIATAGRAAPSLGSGSHIEAQIGTQFSVLKSIAGFLACVEDAQRLRLPSAPFHRRGPTGLHRTQIAKMKNQNKKMRAMTGQSYSQILSCV